MAYQKKQYRNGTSRGGVKGVAVDSSFGSSSNKNRSAKSYKRRENMPPPAGAHFLKRSS